MTVKENYASLIKKLHGLPAMPQTLEFSVLGTQLLTVASDFPVEYWLASTGFYKKLLEHKEMRSHFSPYVLEAHLSVGFVGRFYGLPMFCDSHLEPNQRKMKPGQLAVFGALGARCYNVYRPATQNAAQSSLL